MLAFICTHANVAYLDNCTIKPHSAMMCQKQKKTGRHIKLILIHALDVLNDTFIPYKTTFKSGVHVDCPWSNRHSGFHLVCGCAARWATWGLVLPQPLLYYSYQGNPWGDQSPFLISRTWISTTPWIYICVYFYFLLPLFNHVDLIEIIYVFCKRYLEDRKLFQNIQWTFQWYY